MKPSENAYFVQISDTHFGPTPDYDRYGHYPYPAAKKLVDIINQLPKQPDFVIHTGDVVTHPHPDAYKLAAETFSHLNVPTYFVTGNHDTARDICRYLPLGPHNACSHNPDLLSYSFSVKGYQFLVIDARGPDEIDPHGVFSAEQMEIVRRVATPKGPPLTLFMHYPIFPLDSTWMDAYMLVIDGEQLHEVLLPARQRIRGVFHGHVHQHMQTVRDGIVYASVASAFSQFTAWPGQKRVVVDPNSLPGYSFVHLTPEQTIIHQHIFPRP